MKLNYSATSSRSPNEIMYWMWSRFSMSSKGRDKVKKEHES